MAGRVAAFAAGATPARLALALAAVVALHLLAIVIHAPIEAALRTGPCEGLDCLRPLRPDTRHGGYDAAAFRAYLGTIGTMRGRALLGVAADLPLVAAVACTLLLAAGLASRGMPLSERTQRLILAMPFVYAGADLAENALLALTFSGLGDGSVLLPWASALKFGAAVASGAVSFVIGLWRAVA